MVCKRLTALAVTLLLLGIRTTLAAGGNGTEAAGTVPYLLTAISDQNAQSAECSLGDAVADALRIYLQSDIAIVCGGDLAANLPSGEITWDELRGIFSEDRPLATATVTVKQLREILEVGLSRISMDASEKIDAQASMYAGFPQISGFTLYYDASAPPGGRVRNIVIGNHGANLDDDVTTLTLAATSFMLEGGYGLPPVGTAVPAGLTLAEVTARYIDDGMADYRNLDRIHSMGTADVPITGMLIAGIAIIAVGLSWSRRKLMLRRFSNFER